MALKKPQFSDTKIQPESAETDIEACHEDMDDVRYAQISERAYYKSEARNFAPGLELDDWLAAESEINLN